ncbi:MAG: DUF3793 family protein [Peptoniphilaceae bacterium]
MYKSDLQKFYKFINKLDDLEYLISLIRFNISPTQSNIKLGTLINFSRTNKNLKEIWDNNKYFISNKLEINFFELKTSKKSSLVYFYKKEILDIFLKDKINKEFLSQYGYNCSNTKEYLELLKHNFELKESCPKEIGVFLGYPLDDVRDFNCSNKACKCIGYWKCYNNIEYSISLFKEIDKSKLKTIKEIYLENAS